MTDAADQARDMWMAGYAPPAPPDDIAPRTPSAYPRSALPHVYLAPQRAHLHKGRPIVAVPRHWPVKAQRAAAKWVTHAHEAGQLPPPTEPAAWTLDGEPGDVGGGRWVALLSSTQAARSASRSGTRAPGSSWLASDAWSSPEGIQIEGVGAFTPPTAAGPTWAVVRRARIRKARAYLRTRKPCPAQDAAHQALEDLKASQTAEAQALRAEHAAIAAVTHTPALDMVTRQEASSLRAAHRAALRDAAVQNRILEAAGSLAWGMQRLRGRWLDPLGLNEGQVSVLEPTTTVPAPGPIENCVQGRWLTLGCNAGHRAHMWTGCTKLDCNRCRATTTQQRAQRVWDATSRLANAWGWHVLTVPPELRAAVGQLDPRQVRAAGWAAVERWWASRGFRAGGVVFFHPVGSARQCPEQCRPPVPATGPADNAKCPDCQRTLVDIDGEKWHPHVNVGVPLVGLGRKGARARVMRGWVSKTALWELDREWTRELARMTGSLTQGETVTRLAVTHYRPHHGPQRIRHALRYFARSFPGWSSWTETRGGTRFGVCSNRNHSAFLAKVVDAGLLLDPPASITPCPHPVGDGTCGLEMTVGILGHITTWSGQGPPQWEVRGTAAGPPGETWRQQGTTNGAPQGRLELQYNDNVESK